MADIKTLNDNFRKTFTGGQVLLTAGIDSMSMDDKANILSMVRNFNEFTVSKNEETKKDEITECKGKENKPPITKYRLYLRKFIKAKKLDISEGYEINIGLIKLYDEETQKSQYYSLFNIPKNKRFIYKGNLLLERMQLTELPDLSNVTVDGDFFCGQNKLTTLKGAPQKVMGVFDCSYNPLTSLQGVSPCDNVCYSGTLTDRYKFKNKFNVTYDELITNKEFLREKNLQTQYNLLHKRTSHQY